MAGLALNSQTNEAEERAPGRNKQPIFTLTFNLAWIINFSQYLVFYLLVTTMALYAVTEFAASNAASGLASSAFVIGVTVARMFAGYLVALLGNRLMMVAGILVAVAACVAYLPTSSLPLLIAVRIIHGIGYAVVSSATMALVQQVIPPVRRAEGTGYFALGSTMATAVGPALGLWIVGSFTYDILFITTITTAVLGGLLAIVVMGRAGVEHKEKEGNRTRLTWSAIMHPAVVPIGLFMLIVGCCYAGIITYLNVYGEERDLASFASALAVLGMAQQDWQVVAAGALTGLGYGSLMPAAQAISVRLVPQSEMDVGISTLFLLLDVGVAFGPIALGYLLSAVGYGAMYEVLAVIVLLAAVFYFFIHGRRHKHVT